MKQRSSLPARRLLAAALAAAFGQAPGAASAQTFALPSGPTVVRGTADIQLQGSGERMVITNSPNAVVNWNGFSIGRQNTVIFQQASAASKVLNRVTGNDPSDILGSLQSNGQVWLINPNGVLFGADARVDVGALVASTLGMSNQDFVDGRLAFSGGAAGREVLNQGSLLTSFGGHVWLVGGAVRNEGSIASPGGQIVLAAGRSIDLVDSGLPNLTVRVNVADGDAANLGQLLARGGSIDLHGAIVNQAGIVRAGSLDDGTTGRILIRAARDVILGDGSETSANGDYNAAGGQVVVDAAGGTNTILGSVSATGAGHAGGQIQLLGRSVKVETGEGGIDASGTSGGGQVLIGTAQLADNPSVPNADSVRVADATHIRANATDAGQGGSIVLRSDGSTQVLGSLEARGGPSGGQGGLVETSGAFVDARPVSIDVGAAKDDSGSCLLRADNVTVVDGSCPLCGQAPAAAQETIVSNALVRDVLEQGARVRLEAGSPGAAPQTGKLRVTADVFAAEAPSSGAALTLAAQDDLVADGAVDIGSAASPMPVRLIADLDHSGAGALRLGTGTRVFTGGADLVLGGGSTGFGTAQQIALTGNTLDAGSGTIHVTASTVDIGGSSFLYGGTITVAGTSAISLDNTLLAAQAQGDAIVLSTARLTAAASRLAAPNGRWLTYLDTPAPCRRRCSMRWAIPSCRWARAPAPHRRCPAAAPTASSCAHRWTCACRWTPHAPTTAARWHRFRRPRQATWHRPSSCRPMLTPCRAGSPTGTWAAPSRSPSTARAACSPSPRPPASPSTGRTRPMWPTSRRNRSRPA